MSQKQSMKRLFCQISKVDEEKRTVTGIGASEEIDFEGEIFDYDSSKPYIESWSQEAYERTAGQGRPEAISYGNIRAQHDPKRVAGKLAEPIVFDDAQKLVILKAYISDDDAWQKCLDGSYTGFSIFGPIVGKKWSDPNNPGVLRYTCAPVEFSTVDSPCNPGAVFTAVKAGGMTEERPFKAALAAEKELEVAKAIIAKSMYSIQDLVSVLSSLRWIQDDLAYEAEYEGDQSPIPDKLKAWAAQGCEILVDLTREETAELVGAMKAAGQRHNEAVYATKAIVAKAKTEGLDSISKCIKALDSVSGCITGGCGHKGIEECAKSLAKAHADATKAVSYWADEESGEEEGEEDDDKDSGAQKAAGTTAAGAAPITTQAPPEPETGAEEPMDEATKAQIAAAEQNAAKALELAQQTNDGLAQVAKALGSLTALITNEPIATKSVGAGAVSVVSKSDEMNVGAQKAITQTAESTPDMVAKSILSNPQFIGAGQIPGLNIGR